MIYAQIKDTVVKNTILLTDESLVDTFSADYDDVVRIDNLDPQPGIGWGYDGEDFTAPVDSDQAVEVIADVTPRQMRQALVLMGVYDQIDSTLGSLPEPTKTLAMIEWEYSIAFQRNRPLVAQVAIALGWTNQQVDDLWRFAASL